MAVDPVLDDESLAAALAGLPGWAMRDGSLHRVFELADFTTAFAFMTDVAAVAERLDHHPDWSNSYGRVVIDIISHAAAGVTARCVELAEAADAAATRLT